MARLRGAPLEIRPLTALEEIEPGSVTVRNVVSGRATSVAADLVVVVGERRALVLDSLLPTRPSMQVIGDAVCPRSVHHAIAEGRAAARQLSVTGCTGSSSTSDSTSRSAASAILATAADELGILVGRGERGRHRVGVGHLPEVVDLVEVADQRAPRSHQPPAVCLHHPLDRDHRLVERRAAGRTSP